MPITAYYSESDIKAKLVALDALESQLPIADSLTMGEISITMAKRSDIQKQREYWLNKLAEIQAADTSSGGTGASANKVKFQRPI